VVLWPASTAEEDADAFRRVVELSNSGASLHTIAAALNAEQLVTAQRKRWTSRSVAMLLATSATSSNYGSRRLKQRPARLTGRVRGSRLCRR
jgi:hypothetical protein